VRSFATLTWKPGVPGFSLIVDFLADQQLDDRPGARLEVSRAISSGAWRIRVEDTPDAVPVEVLAA